VINPDATFDTLSIIVKVQVPLREVSPGEIHALAYLSCILSLYEGHPVAEWGYVFAGTKEGTPYSVAITEAIDVLLRTGLAEETQSRMLVASSSGSHEYELLSSLTRNRDRERYLSGACASVFALPINVLRNAISQESVLQRAAALGATRPLFDPPDLDSLYEQFRALSAAIGVQTSELMIPAVTWLSYLARASEIVRSEQP